MPHELSQTNHEPILPHQRTARRGTLRREPELRAAVARWLMGQGIPVEEQVICLAGTADLVAADRSAIYEVKLQLERKALHQAVGQVLLYRQAINPQARAVIVGYATPDTLALIPTVEALGVEVVCWRDEADTKAEAGAEVDEEEEVRSASPSASASLLRFLQWNVAQLALAQGIPNASALATRMGVSRQGVYGIWRGTAQQVALDTLARLARALDADPGDWFTWEVEADDQAPDATPLALQWQVKAQMEARGLRAATLSHRTEVFMRSLGPILDGTAQAVTLEVLGRIARVLDQVQLFNVGTLVRWGEL